MKKLTIPQQEIFDRITNGDRVVEINTHHMNGGRWEWESDKAVIRIRPFWRVMAAMYGYINYDKAKQHFAK
jgi:hypothetical protein